MMYRLLVVLFLLFVISLPKQVRAAMYSYVDERGVKHYTNVPGEGRKKLSMGPRPSRRNRSAEDQLLRTIARHAKGRLARDQARARARRRGKLMPAPATLQKYIDVAARNHRVDPMLIMAVIKAESNFNPNALSSKGAQGLMQLMPATAKDMQVNDPFDPFQNIIGGTKYLRYLLDNYNGDVELSLAAYNAGPGNVSVAGVIPSFPETQAYVARVMETYRTYRTGIPPFSTINVRQLVTIH